MEAATPVPDLVAAAQATLDEAQARAVQASERRALLTARLGAATGRELQLRAGEARAREEEDDDGHLVYQLVVEGADPALVAREHGVSQAELVDLLRDAVEGLAVAHEDTANGYLAEGPEAGLAAALG
jgi:hypothetical protein